MGMLYGAEGEKLSSQEALVESFEPVIGFYREFEKAFGSRNCAEIIHADLNNPEERKKWVDRGGLEECARLCGQTIRLLFAVIGAEGLKGSA